MPEITWETLIGALALVALVAGTQYIRSGASPVKDVQHAVEEGKKKVAGKKKKGKKGAAAVVAKAGETVESVKQEVEARALSTSSGSESPSPSREKESKSGSYAAVAEAAAKEDRVAHDEVVEPASGKAGKKKKNKASKPVQAT